MSDTQNILSSLDIVIIFLVIFLSAGVFFWFRSLFYRFFKLEKKIPRYFINRLAFPGVFIAISLIFKIKAIKKTLSLTQKFDIYLDGILLFFFIFLFIRLIDAFFHAYYSHRKLPFPLPRILHGLMLGVVYLITLFIIMRNILGINITPFLATSAILTMILGLAFQGTLSNIISGMSLHFSKSFTRGDWIQVGSHEGKVIDTNWRETRIIDRASNIIVLPNNLISQEKMTNFSRPDAKTALTISVKAGYEAPPSSVLEALREAAANVPLVIKDPEPQAFILSYDDFGISYLVKFWITDFERKNVILSEVGRLIWYKFRRRGIEIPVSVQDKLLGFVGAWREIEGLPLYEEDREGNFRDLINSSFLRYQEGERAGELLVSEEEVKEFSKLLKRARYTAGEVLFKQGERGESCYIVARGRIRGEIVYEERGKKYISEFRVEKGGIFGEMSLFTGMPRTATGIVEEESELLEIGALDFARLIKKNPSLAEIIAEIVSERNRKNMEFLKKIRELSSKDIEQSCSKRSILSRLKSFLIRTV